MSDIFNELSEALGEVKSFIRKEVKLNQRAIEIRPVPEFSAKDIVQIRNKLHVSQVVFAEMMGTHRRTIEAWESGENQPSGTARRMLQFLQEHTDEALESIVIAK